MDGFIRSEGAADQAYLMGKGFKQSFLLQVASHDDHESETRRAPRSGFPLWFGPQYWGWISYKPTPPSRKLTHSFPMISLPFRLLPTFSFFSARCASRGISHFALEISRIIQIIRDER